MERPHSKIQGKEEARLPAERESKEARDIRAEGRQERKRREKRETKGKGERERERGEKKEIWKRMLWEEVDNDYRVGMGWKMEQDEAMHAARTKEREKTARGWVWDKERGK